MTIHYAPSSCQLTIFPSKLSNNREILAKPQQYLSALILHLESPPAPSGHHQPLLAQSTLSNTDPKGRDCLLVLPKISSKKQKNQEAKNRERVGTEHLPPRGDWGSGSPPRARHGWAPRPPCRRPRSAEERENRGEVGAWWPLNLGVRPSSGDLAVVRLRGPAADVCRRLPSRGARRIFVAHPASR